jgi:hypothetical protein
MQLIRLEARPGEEMRKVFLVIAIVLIAVVFLIELGSSIALKQREPSESERCRAVLEQDEKPVPSAPCDSPFLDPGSGVFEPELVDQLEEMKDLSEDPERETPGLGIPYLALLDGIVLFTVGLMGISLLLKKSTHGRIQGILTLILALLVILGGIILIIVAFALLMIMIGLLTAVPFGTLAYLAIWGFFERTGANATLGVLMGLKIAFAVCMVLAHQRMLQSKGLVLLVLTSLLGNLIVGFLHGIVPLFLVSITDAIAAIVIGILAVIWAIILLIGAIISIIKIIKVEKQSVGVVQDTASVH